jgi:copper chaperone CopZ
MRIYWRRLFHLPRTSVLGCEGETVRLRIEGLACDLCAARARRGLLSLPGVREATVDLATGTASVKADAPPSAEAIERAVGRTVIFPRLRRWLDGLRRALGRQPLGRRGGAT